MRIVEVIHAHGHSMVKATHPTTLEITKDEHLTPMGDCIIAIGASKGAADLSQEFKEAAKNPAAKITLIINVDGMVETVKGFGFSKLSFKHSTDLVARKSSYTCPRTLMVKADLAAGDLPRKMVRKLRSRKTAVTVKLMVEV